MKNREQMEEKWRAEQREWARGNKETRRRIQKRQWARRQRAALKGAQAVTVYFPKGLLAEIDEDRPKGMGRSKMIVELLKIGLVCFKEELKKELAKKAAESQNIGLN